MIADSTPAWSEAEIEAESRNAIGSIRHLNPWLPNIESVIQAFDATIEINAALRRHGVFAVTCRRRKGNGTKYVVLVDAFHADRDPDSEYRLTISEELGHIVLHGAMISALKTESDFLELHRRNDWHRIECEARHFARAALVPRKELNLKVPELYSESVDRFGFTTSLSLVKRIVSLGATLFNAPPEAVQRRLHELPDDLMSRIVGSCEVRSDSLLTSNDLASLSPDIKRSACQPWLFDPEVPMER